MNIPTLFESIVDDAKKFATEKHEGQTRKSGGPYIKHPERVAEIVRTFKKSHKLDHLISAALLHDTVEDTNTTEKDLETMFGGLIASLVKELTSNEDEIQKVGKKDYLANKMTGMSSWGLVIKLADRLDNVSDLNTSNPVFAKRYSEETRYILSKLEVERKLSMTQKRIIEEIKKKLDEVKA
jgi:(p)ppGpp synthase/HD superfamily hydrolase